MFKQHCCIPAVVPKQIQNELHFLILINHPSPQLPGSLTFLFFHREKLSPAKIDHCLQLAMCLFIRDSNHKAPHAAGPKTFGVFSLFFSLQFTVVHAEETAFISYRIHTIGTKPCVAWCRSAGKAWGMNLSSVKAASVQYYVYKSLVVCTYLSL